ncbi:unnamed protein product [Rotaria sordida]|uniref:G-protein coupled receptors family 1 profile domain-containing protein n=1 Tax=Rotaria sordida TaxID=392033 RepID=A0A819XAQ2_9BILA|nr:unnamed protein product [Rotaria sordida]CAF1242223.1 unnamed protein product [Rotaria sordida]CAF4137901.1 unnamed protein product [Rotaria sordida]CAF4184931.1 unnamed protein product [Rotaria sordida]
MSLAHIGQQLTIYGGMFIVIGGVIGNGMNILVFSSVRTYRTAPCTFYFLIASIFNIAVTTINLISRIVSAGFGVDLTRSSVSWCKIRQFCLVTLSLITLSCSCLATIDQFFITSQSASIRRLSSIKWAHRIVLIVILVWCLHGIPYLLFYNILPIIKACGNTNGDLAVYNPIYLLGLLCITPVSVMVVFGYLTYRNIHLRRALAEQQADRQVTRMTLIQVILVVICIVPYGINIAYNVATSGISKDANRLLIENFVQSTITLTSYIYFGGSCYVFLISSSRFRRVIKDRILCWGRSNQVIPIQQPICKTAPLENRTYN